MATTRALVEAGLRRGARRGGGCLGRPTEQATSYLAWVDAGSSPGRFDTHDILLRRGQLPGDIALRGSRTSVTFWPIARAGTTNTLDFEP